MKREVMYDVWYDSDGSYCDDTDDDAMKQMMLHDDDNDDDNCGR